MEQQVEKKRLPDVFKVLGDAIKNIAINPTVFVIFLAFSLLSATLIYLGGGSNSGPDGATATYANISNLPLFISGIGISVIGSIILAGPLFAYTLAVAKKEKKTTNEVFKALKYSAPVVIASILSGLAVLGGFILLIIPGIILAVRFAFAPYAVVEKGQGPIKALKESFRMTKGYVLALLGRFIVLGILAIILAGVLSLVPILGGVASQLISLVLYVVCARFYLSLSENRAEALPRKEESTLDSSEATSGPAPSNA